MQFTPYERAPNDPSYLGYSKEPGAIKGYSKAGFALDAIGDVGSLAIKAADTLTKIGLDDELENKLYKLRAEDTAVGRDLLLDTKSALGLSTGAAGKGPEEGTAGQGGSTPAALPVPIEQGLARLQKLEQALKMGKGSDVAYSGEGAAIVQNLRSRFPGYGQYITDKATHILGGNPFNMERTAIQQSLLQLYNQRSSTEKDWNTYVVSHGQYMNPTLFSAAQAATTEVARADIRARVADIQHDDFLTKKLDATLRAKAAAGKLTEDDMQGHIDNLGGKIANRVFKEMQFTASGFTGSGQQMLDVVMKAYQEGVPPDPKVLQAIGGVLQQARSEYRRAFNDAINTPNYIANKDTGNLEPAKEGQAGDKVSLSSLRRNTEAIEGIRKKYEVFFDTVEEQIGKGYMNWGTVSAATISTIGDNTAAQMIAIPIFQKYKGMEKLLGPAAQAFLNSSEFMTNFKGLAEGARALNQLNVMDTLSGASSNPNLYDNIIKRSRELNPGTRADAATGIPMTSAEVRTSVDTLKKLFTSKELTIDDRVKAGKVLANSGTIDFIGHFSANERFNIWSDVFSPEVSKAMKDSNPELWQQYKTTGNNIFKRLFNEWIDSANKYGNDQGRLAQLNIKWNEDLQQFDYNRSKAEVSQQGQVIGPRYQVANPLASMGAVIDRLNTGLRVVSGYLAQDNQKITPEWLNQTGINIGIETDDILSKKILNELKNMKTEPKAKGDKKAAVEGPDGSQFVNVDGKWFKINTAA